MNKEANKTVRCAIPTRNSSDEGLDQAFNSLDARREVGEAYVNSQASEGRTVGACTEHCDESLFLSPLCTPTRELAQAGSKRR